MTENDDNRQSAFYFNKEEGKNTHKSTRRSARFLHNKQFDLKSSKEKNTHKKHKCNAGPTKRNETETLIRVMFASWTGQLYTHSFAYRWETWNGTKECKYSSFSYKMDYLVTFFFQRNYTNRNPAKKDLRKKKNLLLNSQVFWIRNVGDLVDALTVNQIGLRNRNKKKILSQFFVRYSLLLEWVVSFAEATPSRRRFKSGQS